MKVIEETIGSTPVLIQTMDDELEIVGGEQGGRATQLTGIEDKIKDAYVQTKSVIKEFAQDVGAELAEIRTTARPKEVQMEFNIGISAQYGAILVFGGKGETGMKVTMTWEVGEIERSG